MHLDLLVAAALATLATASPAPRAAPMTPNGKKAGSAGGNAVPYWKDHIGWWYDWTPEPKYHNEVPGVSMLWGGGNNGQQDAQRFKDFKNLSYAPKYLLGFNEPDCSAPDVSSKLTVDQGVQLWNQYIAPKGDQGSLLGSPSMCAQKDESWLSQFRSKHLNRDWDFTAIHVYKPDMQGVKDDIEHYWTKYGKPIWITELGCVYDQQGFKACTDQGQINQWIRDVVDLLEKDNRVAAYAYTNDGLSDAWRATNGNGLSESGRTYLDAISKYH